MKLFTKSSRRKKRILYFSMANEVGGAEKYLQQLISNIDLTLFDAALVTSGHATMNDWIARFDSQKIDVVRLSGGRHLNLKYFFKLVRLFRQADVLHFNFGCPAADKWALLAGWFSRTPKQIATVHLVEPYRQKNRWLNWLSRRLLKFWYRKINNIILVSSASQKQFCKYFKIRKSKTTVIHNGIAIQACQIKEIKIESRRKIRLPQNKLLIGTVGRLHPQKGHDVLINAAKIVIRSVPDCHFVLAGDGELRPKLIQQIQNLKLAKFFTILGFRTDIPRILNALDLFVLPSLAESFPFSILEAMAAGLPVLATNVGGVAELVVHQENGKLVPSGNVRDLAWTIIELLKNPRRMQMMGQSGRVKVNQYFDLNNMLLDTFSLYQ